MKNRGIIAILASLGMAQLGMAQQPALLTQAFPGTGGDSVTGGGEWSVITDDVTCATQIYRLNYLTMEWVFSETELPILEATCTAGAFGQASSLNGNLLVVGIPGWDGLGGGAALNFGGVAVVEYGTAWDRVTGLSGGLLPSAFGFVEVAPTIQNGSLYGASVSVSRSPSNPNQYLVVVGAPLWDSGGFTDNGQVYAYRYNAATNALTFIASAAGNTNNGNLGFAVTADYPFFLAGEPGADPGGNANAGAARLYVLTDVNPVDGLLDTLALDETLVATAAPNGGAGAQIGVEVSLSAEFAQVSGALNAFAWYNTGDAVTRNFAIRNVNFPSEGGDVSQTAGVGAFGFQGVGEEGANLYRNPIENAVPQDAVKVDVKDQFAGDLSDIGIDIRLVRESLWFANPVQGRALLYRFPAGLGGQQEAFVFSQRNLPCEVDGLTVAQVFGYLGAASTNGSDGDYALYRYDDSDVTDATPYQLMQGTDTFAGGQDYSLWLITAVDANVPLAACNGFTVPDYAVAPGGVGLVGAMPARVKAQKVVSLPDRDLGAGFGRVLVNNPFPREARLADILYVDDTFAPKSLADAQTALEISATFYVYDASITNPNGQHYRAVTSAGTPPFKDRIQGHEGFWVRVLQNGVGSGAFGSHALLMPHTE